MKKPKVEILKEFELFSVPTGGIGSWLSNDTHDDVFDRIGTIDKDPLTAVQLNQLLVLGHEAPVSDGFFRYYWLHTPEYHSYEVREVPGFQDAWLNSNSPAIASLDHLKWGLYRLYIDALLYFGNVRTAFRQLRELAFEELIECFRAKRFDTKAIKRRGPPLPLKDIAKDNRYLIAEMHVSHMVTPQNPQETSVKYFYKHSKRTLLPGGTLQPFVSFWKVSWCHLRIKIDSRSSSFQLVKS